MMWTVGSGHSLPLLSVPQQRQRAGHSQLPSWRWSGLETRLLPGFRLGWAPAAATRFSGCSVLVRPARPAGPVCWRSAGTASTSETRAPPPAPLLTHHCQRTEPATPYAAERTPGLWSGKEINRHNGKAWFKGNSTSEVSPEQGADLVGVICVSYRLPQVVQLLTPALASHNTLQVSSYFTQLQLKSLHLREQSVMVLLVYSHAERERQNLHVSCHRLEEVALQNIFQKRRECELMSLGVDTWLVPWVPQQWQPLSPSPPSRAQTAAASAAPPTTHHG